MSNKSMSAANDYFFDHEHELLEEWLIEDKNALMLVDWLYNSEQKKLKDAVVSQFISEKNKTSKEYLIFAGNMFDKIYEKEA